MMDRVGNLVPRLRWWSCHQCSLELYEQYHIILAKARPAQIFFINTSSSIQYIYKHTVGGGVVSAESAGCVGWSVSIEDKTGCSTLRWLLGIKPVRSPSFTCNSIAIQLQWHCIHKNNLHSKAYCTKATQIWMLVLVISHVCFNLSLLPLLLPWNASHTSFFGNYLGGSRKPYPQNAIILNSRKICKLEILGD